MGSVLRRAWTRVVVNAGYFRGPRYASALRMAWVRLRNPQADIRFGKNTYLGPGFSLHMPRGGTFIAGRSLGVAGAVGRSGRTGTAGRTGTV